MVQPTPIAYPVRLDELINAIKKVHTNALDQLCRRRSGRPSISARSPTT